MTDFRALCAELVNRFYKLYGRICDDDTVIYVDNEVNELMSYARAALAESKPPCRYIYNPAQIAECGGPCEQGPEHCDCGELWMVEPAVPEGREPASVVSEPSDEEIMELWHGSDWYNEGATLREFLSITRAVLARWGRPAPHPPIYGKVAELAGKLVEAANGTAGMSWDQHVQHILRAAELLQRQYPQPVPVSERLPRSEDCDAEGKCWWGRSESDDWYADWTLATHEAVAEFCEFSPQAVWLPAHALPLPDTND